MADWLVGVGKTYAHPQAALEAMALALGTTPFTEEHRIIIDSGTYENAPFGYPVLAIHTVNPTSKYRLKVMAATGATPIFYDSTPLGVVLIGTQLSSVLPLSFVTISGIRFKSASVNAYSMIPWYNLVMSQGITAEWIMEDCILEPGIIYPSLSNLNGLKISRCRPLGYQSESWGAFGNHDSSLGFQGTLTLRDLIWYCEAGLNITGAAGRDIGLDIENCTMWGRYRGMNLSINSPTITDYRISLRIKNSVLQAGSDLARMLNVLPQNDVDDPHLNLQCVDVDYNCYYGAASNNFLHAGATNPWNCSDFAAWKSEFNCDAHSIFADPKFKIAPVFIEGDPTPQVDPVDFSLADDSPCLQAGVSGAAAVDIADTDRPTYIDLGAYQSTVLTLSPHSYEV